MFDEHQENEINRQALFSDETQDYRYPEEPDAGETVTLRFRTAKNDVDQVFYIEEDKNIQAEMRKVSSDSLFDYYEYRMEADSQPQRYYFQVVKGSAVCYFNRLGATMDIQSCYAFRITPGFHTPEWAKGAVMYQIFVDRFCNGDQSNDVTECEYVYIGRPVHQVTDWSTNPSTMDVGCFYGGDLQGVWDKLDYLQYLGVEVIYFNPLFVSPSNHKYDSQDYDHIDPHYGVIVKDGGEPVAANAVNNDHATRYQVRSADPENLAASDAFLPVSWKKFTGAACGSSSTVCSITAAPLINGWIERKFTATREAMSQALMKVRKARTAASLSFTMRTHGRITEPMTAGGDMTRCRS